jgi:hypothetical protein
MDISTDDAAGFKFHGSKSVIERISVADTNGAKAASRRDTTSHQPRSTQRIQSFVTGGAELLGRKVASAASDVVSAWKFLTWNDLSPASNCFVVFSPALRTQRKSSSR